MKLGYEWARLDGEDITLILVLHKDSAADCAYLGPRLPDEEGVETLIASQTRGRHENQPDQPPLPGLLPGRAAGWKGTPALSLVERDGERVVAVDCQFAMTSWSAGPSDIRLTYHDTRLNLVVQQFIAIQAGDVFAMRGEISNLGTRDFELTRFSALAFPLPARFTEMTEFSGRWASEMHATRRAIGAQGYASRSAAGKPGFAGGSWVLLHDPLGGEVLGAHLAWSGDYDTVIEGDQHGASDNRAVLQMAQRWDCGEVPLSADPASGVFTTCQAYITMAPDRSVLAQRFHQHMRVEVLRERTDWSPRKVHLNSWEALGFNLSHEGLIKLADRAAELGVERFVLDDGWFAGRRNDTTSLGDWSVCPDVLPYGLDPLIAHIREQGMDFGLWVEPEMVSPDSALYRAHPDWCLHAEGRERPTMRNQLMLDLSRTEVFDFLFDRLDALLSQHEIAYLKWDHNRDHFPASGRGFAQTGALYDLLDRLRAKHPAVEIESCASGGGRIDYGILSRTDRVWPSDNNDPIERVRIIRAWSQFLPLEVLGNHVGPSPNPITGRQSAIDFRAKVAMFGHMGVEADPGTMSAGERECLAKHIALYKHWREVLHSGRLSRLSHPSESISGLIAVHRSEALAIVTQTQFEPQFDAAPIRLAGLDPTARYRVTLPLPWPGKASLYLPDWERWRNGFTLTGAALMTQGLALPLTHPETAWLVALERTA